MGYTHYFTLNGTIKQHEWDGFIEDFKQILPEFENLLDSTTGQKLVVAKDILFFNGIGEESHETFSLTMEDSGFAFCKTAQKPYDIAVTCALVIAKARFGAKIDVSGDGGEEGFNEAKQLCQKILNYGADMVIEV